jgi:hypothetical protein
MFVETTPEGLPTGALTDPDSCVGFLVMNIELSQAIQLLHDCHKAKFAITNQKDRCPNRNHAVNIGQQHPLLNDATVYSDMLDPRSGDWDRLFTINQTDDQLMISKAILGAKYYQADVSQIAKLGFQPMLGDELITIPYSNGRDVQQPAQVASGDQHLYKSWFLDSNPDQGNRPTLNDTNDQPDKLMHLCSPLFGSHFQNPLEMYDRENWSYLSNLVSKNVWQKGFAFGVVPNSYSVIKYHVASPNYKKNIDRSFDGK